MFSSKSLIESGLTFRSLIHFEFIFGYGVRKCSNLINLLPKKLGYSCLGLAVYLFFSVAVPPIVVPSPMDLILIRLVTLSSCFGVTKFFIFFNEKNFFSFKKIFK